MQDSEGEWLISLSFPSSRWRFPTARRREFLALTGQMQALVRRKGYGTNQLLRTASHPRRYYDIRIWRNAESAAQAESDREIKGLRRDLQQHLHSTPLVDVAWAVEVGLAAAGPVAGARASLGERRVRERRSSALHVQRSGQAARDRSSRGPSPG